MLKTDNFKNPKSYFILAVCLIHFILGLDINIVSVSLPALAKHFGLSVNEISRVAWVYFLVLTSLLLIWGKLGDIWGFKKLYLFGIIIFLTGSLMCGLSLSFNFLLLSRIVQASGAAMLFSLTPAIIASYISVDSRGKIFGINYSFVAIGGIVGRGLSGYIIENLGWQSIFLINIPVGIVSLIILLIFFPEVKKVSSNKTIDIKGFMLSFVAFFLLLYAFNNANELGWTSPYIILCFFSSLCLFILFYVTESGKKIPFIDLSLIRNPDFSLSTISFFVIYIITNGMVFIFPFYLQSVKQFPLKEAGFMMVIPSVMQAVTGYIAGIFADKIGCRKICLTGITLSLISYFLFIFLSPSTEIIFIILALVIFGIAIGMFVPANTNMIMSYAPDDKKGIISGLMISFNRAGSALGVCLFSAIFSFYVPAFKMSEINPSQTFVGIKYTFIFGFTALIISLFATYFSKENKNKI
jgi:EmrB/QacA subfamily drug resistance transporter